MQSCVLIKFGEIVLKGRNRSVFYSQLRRNVVRLLRDLGPLELRQRGGALAVLAPVPAELLVDRARDVLGVTLLHPALVLEKSADAACAAAVDLLRDRPGRTFAVRHTAPTPVEIAQPTSPATSNGTSRGIGMHDRSGRTAASANDEMKE